MKKLLASFVLAGLFIGVVGCGGSATTPPAKADDKKEDKKEDKKTP